MRALLIVNDAATATTLELRNHVTSQLRSALGVDVEHTTHAGHATELAGQAAAAKYDVVIALGGDGTVNEVATGLMDSGSTHTSLAAIPGGNANVFVRNLGYPGQPTAATQRLVAALANGRSQTVGVGLVTAGAHRRYFLCNAGVGLDAHVVAAVAAARGTGRASDGMYVKAAIRTYLRHPQLRRPTLHVDGIPAATVLVVNLSPWTYLGKRPLDPAPRATPDSGLVVIAPQRLTIWPLAAFLWRVARGGDVGGLAGVFTATQAAEARIQAQPAAWLQVDGDAVAQVTSASFTHLPHALRIAM